MTTPGLRFDHRLPTRPMESMLSSYAPLSAEDVALLRHEVRDVTAHAAGSEARGVDPDRPRVVLSGWFGWQTLFADGRRQIVCLALPGDLIMDCPTGDLPMSHIALSTAQTASVSGLLEGGHLRRDCGPGLARAWALAREAAATRSIHQTLRLGRMSGLERMASLLLELHERLQRCGLADKDAMRLPLTQEVISDVMGLSVVHVNRILQQLRRDGLILSRAGQLWMPDRTALQRATGRRFG